jgi:hypothetical protein
MKMDNASKADYVPGPKPRRSIKFVAHQSVALESEYPCGALATAADAQNSTTAWKVTGEPVAPPMLAVTFCTPIRPPSVQITEADPSVPVIV